MSRINIFIFSTFFVTTVSLAQNFVRPNEWKKYRHEFNVGFGSAHFLGDLGGRDRVGTDFSPVDLDLRQTRTAFSLGHRYRIYKWLNYSTRISHMILRGDDKETAEPYRNNRNLNFKSNVFELAAHIEIGYTKVKAGNRYGIKKTLTRRISNRYWSIYGYTGIGGFYYNPKGRMPNGRYVALRLLHTEGQGLPGGPKKYGKYNISIPFGLHYKMVYNKNWAFGLDLCWRKTFTDYIDDVGGVYYDPQALKAAYGPLSAQMADPSLGTIPTATMPNADGSGAQRGDLEKDSYFTAQLTFGYIMKDNRRKKARLRSKF